jgi:hypothetical protein
VQRLGCLRQVQVAADSFLNETKLMKVHIE